MIPRVVSVQDISCFGKCSLTAAIPVISAMGVEAVVLPTAVLSTHTGGFTGYTFHDLTDDLPAVIEHWERLNLHFDSIYVGYLGSIRQIDMIKAFIQKFKSKDTTVIIDPVMGDFGKFYAGFQQDFANAMKSLCSYADVICPNLTEAMLLVGEEYHPNMTIEQLQDVLVTLTKTCCKKAVITGVRPSPERHGAMGYDADAKTFFSFYRNHVEEPMHGTGDIFASVLSAAMAKGSTLSKAVEIAVNFTSDAIQATVDDLRELPRDSAPWYGVEFEKCIGNLVKYASEI